MCLAWELRWYKGAWNLAEQATDLLFGDELWNVAIDNIDIQKLILGLLQYLILMGVSDITLQIELTLIMEAGHQKQSGR